MSRETKQVRHHALELAFANYDGPNGRGPVQFSGRLKTGEWVYFRARENHVLLEVYRCKSHWLDTGKRLAFYQERVPYDAGTMPVADCVRCISRFIRAYNSGRVQR